MYYQEAASGPPTESVALNARADQPPRTAIDILREQQSRSTAPATSTAAAERSVAFAFLQFLHELEQVQLIRMCGDELWPLAPAAGG